MDPDPDSDPDPAIFIIDLQDANKQKSFSSDYFWKVHLHHFSKIKSPKKEVTKQYKNQGFLTIFA
jgi:hypothetical protein